MRVRRGVDEDTVRFFVWSVWSFFQSSTKQEPEVGTPYLFETFEHDDYTGIIAMLGARKGTVHFTMSREMVDAILQRQGAAQSDRIEDDEQLEERRKDYMRVMTKIVASNVRNYLCEPFLVSVPVVATVKGEKLRRPKASHGIIFPVNWAGYRSHLVLSLGGDLVENGGGK
ncbi:chemotaxis protein CheX [Rubritalea spongiae]